MQNSKKTVKIDKKPSSENVENSMDTNLDASLDTEKTNVQDTRIPVTQPVESSLTVHESELEKERIKAERMLLAMQLLEAGYSIRTIHEQTKISKGVIEKASKRLQKRPGRTTAARTRWNEKPYADALKKEANYDEDLQYDLFESGWYERQWNKMQKMKIQMNMMEQFGLITRNPQHNNPRQQIDINSILLTKAASGGSLKEIAEMLSIFKNMGMIGGEDTFLQKYQAMEVLKDKAVKQHAEIEQTAYAKADRDSLKNVITKGFEEGLPVIGELAKKVIGKPKIPHPSLEMPEPVNPVLAQPHSGILAPPNPGSLESLKLPVTPGKTVIVPEATELPDDVGYSNLSVYAGKKPKER